MTTTTARTTSGATPSKILHIALWVVQALLALAFGSAGLMKITQPLPALVEKMVWPGAVPEALVRFIGTAELLGALGLILPAAFRIKPILTPLAGLGLATIMILAALFHLSRGEFGALPMNIVLGGLAAFVAWGRLKKAPIAPG
jgi:putative oxidoreductase